MASFKTVKAPQDSLAYTNKIFLSSSDFKSLCGKDNSYIQVNNNYVFTADSHEKSEPGTVGFNSLHRKFLDLALNATVQLEQFNPSSNNHYASRIYFEIDFLTKSSNAPKREFDAEELNQIVLKNFDQQYFKAGQTLVIEKFGSNLLLTVKQVYLIDFEGLKALKESDEKTPNKNKKTDNTTGNAIGKLSSMTSIYLAKAEGSNLNLVGGEDLSSARTLFEPNWNFDNMGIGGLDTEFKSIFRRAFASRVFPPAIIKRLGIQHVRGLLLFGPPGTGKTLMARQIAQMLKAREPKIVNGPDVFDKYVGETERKIRELFADAEAEWKQKGPNSELHIIIFDEIDAICKKRGSTRDSTGVADTVVNQLLTKLDGVDSANNFLVIGMTNRKDMLDEALLRPGRLEIQMEIGLPDEHGRLQILNIHTAHMKQHKALGADVNLEKLASITKNYSGAEIEGVVRNAASYAFNRNIDVKEGIQLTDTDIKVTMDDFEHAISEYKPHFGVKKDEFENCGRNGFYPFNSQSDAAMKLCKVIIEQVRTSDRTPLVSILLEGTIGCGKTTFAAKLATESEYPMARLLSPDTLLGYGELGKVSQITTVFEDIYKSPLSVIVLDDIERLINYVQLGPMFSNPILQTLLVLLKRPPPKGRRLLIVGTTSSPEILKALGLYQSFDKVLQLPQIESPDQLASALKYLGFATSEEELGLCKKAYVEPISIKKLIMVAELASQAPKMRFTRLQQALLDFAEQNPSRSLNLNFE